MRIWSKFVALPLVLAGAIVVGLQSPAAAPEPAGPPGVAAFELDVQGVGVFVFSRCAGVGSETDVIEYNDGGNVSHLPGDTTPLVLTCMRGYDENQTLAAWRSAIVEGSADPTAASLVMYDLTLQEIGRWNYIDLWPRTLVVQLDGSNVAYEVVSFVADNTFVAP